MACAPVRSGDGFLGSMLAHVDCQAQAIGAYGYGALADRGSGASLALTGLLTVFVAIFGIRLMLGSRLHGSDLAGDILKLAIVLTLASSWPAWRKLGYDLVMRGPLEVSAPLGRAADLPGSDGDAHARFQRVDDAIVTLTMYGTGRRVGGAIQGMDPAESFRGIAIADDFGLGFGRVAFLAGTIAPVAVVKLSAGILLAIAPLMAGLLLFAGTSGIFFGWLRGLAAAALGALALALVQAAQLAIVEPWLEDALARRAVFTAAPSVPTELLAMMLVFAVLSFAVLAMAARIAFSGVSGLPRLLRIDAIAEGGNGRSMAQRATGVDAGQPSRAVLIADAVSQTMRREELATSNGRPISWRALSAPAANAAATAAAPGSAAQAAPPPLGESHRRSYRRTSAAGGKRDTK